MMAAGRESRTFRKGLRLGAVAGVGLMLWNAPQAGARTREQIVESIESVLFRLLDMPSKMRGNDDNQQTERLPIILTAPKLRSTAVEPELATGGAESSTH